MVFRSPCRLSPAVLPAPLMDLKPPFPSAAQSLPGEAPPCPPPARGGCHRSLLNTNRLSGGFIVAPGNWGRRAGSFRGMCLSGQRPIGTRAFANFSVSLSSSLRPFQGVPEFFIYKPRGKLSSVIACLALALWVGCSCPAGFQGLAPWSGPGIPSVREAPSALLLELQGKRKSPPGMELFTEIFASHLLM